MTSYILQLVKLRLVDVPKTMHVLKYFLNKIFGSFVIVAYRSANT